MLPAGRSTRTADSLIPDAIESALVRGTPATSGSTTHYYIRVTRKEPPRTSFVLPDVREAALDRVPGDEAGAGRVAKRLHRLQPHDHDERSIGADELDLAVERRKVNDAGTHEGIEDGASSDYHLVVR